MQVAFSAGCDFACFRLNFRVATAHSHAITGQKWLVMIVRFLCQHLLKTARSRIARPAVGGIPPTAQARGRLESIVEAFMDGFQAAVGGKYSRAQSEEVPRPLHGFWFEGAAMGVVLRDWLVPWKRAGWERLLGETGEHIYMLHVGAGWAMARVPIDVDKTIARFDPLLRWLLVDGYGFHETFFHPERVLHGQPHPRRVRGYAKRAFDQGVGRAMWFASGANVRAIVDALAKFSAERLPDLWSGVGLASVYAGGVDVAEIGWLRDRAGTYLPNVAQGAAFAAKARIRAGNLTEQNESACAILCGLCASDAAAVTDAALENLPVDGPESAFEIWRRRIQHVFVEKAEPIHL